MNLSDKARAISAELNQLTQRLPDGSWAVGYGPPNAHGFPEITHLSINWALVTDDGPAPDDSGQPAGILENAG